jgi:hypothetical protein
LVAPQLRAIGTRLAVIAFTKQQGKIMTLGTILLIILILMLVGALPTWPHSRSWGYRPTGFVGIVVIVVLVLLLTGNI